MKEVWKEKKGKAVEMPSEKKHTYADVVRGYSQEKWKGKNVETKHQVLPWMAISMIGHMKPIYNHTRLCEEFIKEGLNMVTVRFMGDSMALLTPKGGERMHDILNQNKAWFDRLFETIAPWSESITAEHKIIWARCFGLPLSLWTKDCFSKVIGEAATLVSIDEATETWDNLEFARLQLRVLNSGFLSLSKNMRINGQPYTVCIVEEAECVGGGSCRCKCYSDDYMESISSSDSVVEESIFSLNSSKDGDDDAGRELRQGEGPEKADKTLQPSTTKSMPMEEWSGKEKVAQKVGNRSYTNEERRKQMNVEGEAPLSVIQKVNSVCLSVQSALNSLMDLVESCGDTLVKPIMLEAHVGSEGAHFLGERRSIERPKPVDACDMEKPVERPLNAATGLVYHRRGKKGGLISLPPLAEARGEHQTLKVPNGSMQANTQELTTDEGPQTRLLNHGLIKEAMVRDDDGRPLSSEPTEELQATVGDDYGTPLRVRRLRAMWELGETSVKKRWRSKGGVGSVLYSPSRLSVSSGATYDSDLAQRKDRSQCDVTLDEPVNLWEVGKSLGLSNSGDEEDIVKEYGRMEERDKEVAQQNDEGNHNRSI